MLSVSFVANDLVYHRPSICFHIAQTISSSTKLYCVNIVKDIIFAFRGLDVVLFDLRDFHPPLGPTPVAFQPMG